MVQRSSSVPSNASARVNADAGIGAYVTVLCGVTAMSIVAKIYFYS